MPTELEYGKITALAGGVGAAKFLEGLAHVVNPEGMTVIGNVGDDIDWYGLRISPDLDIVMYTLAGIVDASKGWGIENDSFHCLTMLNKLGYEAWFNVGDMDLAVHVMRTYLLKMGHTPSWITRMLCNRLGVRAKIIPVTDDPLRTFVLTDEGPMQFQEYYVKRRCEPKILRVEFKGSNEAKPAPGVIEAIMGSGAVMICPSNPVVSIGPILSVRDVEKALLDTNAKIAAISPIVGGKPIKGPADKFMKALGIEVSAYGVASIYSEFLDLMVIDAIDRRLKPRIEKELKVKVLVTNTIMNTMEDRINLARTVLQHTIPHG